MGTNLEEIYKEFELVLQTGDLNVTKESYTRTAREYDQNMIKIGYNGPSILVNEILEHNFPKSIRILDIGAGTGASGALLNKKGYTNIDALEPNEEMLNIAKQHNCYKNFFTDFVVKDNKLPIEDNCYDLVLLCGCLVPGHIKWDTFPEIIRITKSGGYIFIVDTGYGNYGKYSEEFSDENTTRIIESLCEKEQWKILSGFPKLIDDFETATDGQQKLRLLAMKVN